MAGGGFTQGSVKAQLDKISPQNEEAAKEALNRNFAVAGTVGYSTIKKGDVKDFGKYVNIDQETLETMYMDGVKEFYRDVTNFLLSCDGVEKDDIAFAVAPSFAGVDRAVQEFAKNKFKAIAVGPSIYLKYTNGYETKSEEFPDGYYQADFDMPLFLTRSKKSEDVKTQEQEELEAYRIAYSRAVGPGNPLVVTGGKVGSYLRDIHEAYSDKNGPRVVPVDIMRDIYEIIIPSYGKDGQLTNAAAATIGNHGDFYTQYKFYFETIDTKDPSLKDEIRKNPAKMAVACILHNKIFEHKKRTKNAEAAV